MASPLQTPEARIENHIVALQRDFTQQLGSKNLCEKQPWGQSFYNNNLLYQCGLIWLKTGPLHHCT